MKVYDSGRSEESPGPLRSLAGSRLIIGHQRAVYAVAAVWLLAHVPFLSPSLEDIDSINFALGLRHFDPALHQPHPPGYPLYIGLGHVSLAALSWLAPSLSDLRVEAVALAVWSLAGGALAIVAAAMFYRALEDVFP